MGADKVQLFVVSADKLVYDAAHAAAHALETSVQVRPVSSLEALPTVARLTDCLILDPDHPLGRSSLALNHVTSFPGRVIVVKRANADTRCELFPADAVIAAPGELAEKIRQSAGSMRSRRARHAARRSGQTSFQKKTKPGKPTDRSRQDGSIVLDRHAATDPDPASQARLFAPQSSLVATDMAHLLRLARRLMSLSDRQFFESAVEQASALFGARRGSLYECDAARSMLILRHAIPRRQLPAEVPLTSSARSPMALAAASRRLHLIENWDGVLFPDGPVERANACDYETTSCAILPVVAGAELLGVINLADPAGREAFRPEAHQPLAEALSDLLATAWQNVRLYEQSQLAARADGLTGLANFRTFGEHLAREVTRARRYGTPLSLIMIDVDGLKPVNDRYGHQAGDWSLQGVAVRIAAGIREMDLAARCGGDEFAVILPNTSLGAAHQVAQRLADDIYAHPITWQSIPLGISISLGVGQYAGQLSVDEFVRSIDLALYESKTSGRNRVTVRDLSPGRADASTPAARFHHVRPVNCEPPVITDGSEP